MIVIKKEQKDFLQQHYLYVTPDGKQLTGLEGFTLWAGKSGQKQDTNKMILEYIRVRTQANQYINKDHYLEVTVKLKNTFEKNWLDKLFYADFYSLPRFGKTKLGWQVYYGKSSENIKLINAVAREIKPSLEKIISREKVTMVGFIPHSLPRKIEFLKQLRQELNLPELERVELDKAYAGSLKVAQKSLTNLADRIENARETIMVGEGREKVKGQRILLIDDAVGSGATLNEVAKKLKVLGAAKVFGYAVVGSLKGFEVIREV